MAEVMLIEDAEDCQLVVKDSLSKLGIEPQICKTLEEARSAAQRVAPGEIDMILLDRGLPDGDGLELLKNLDDTSPIHDVPVVLLTGRGDLTSKVAAFGLGAEDYLVKPICPIELRARVEVRLRKSTRKAQAMTIVRAGELVLDFLQLRATISRGDAQLELELTLKEFKILSLLAQNGSRTLSRNEIITAVWGKGVHVLDRTVDSHIYSLRKKLGASATCLKSVPGLGYCFAPRYSSQTR